VAGPSGVVKEFCSVWSKKTGYFFAPRAAQRVYGIQEAPKYDKALSKSKPKGQMRLVCFLILGVACCVV